MNEHRRRSRARLWPGLGLGLALLALAGLVTWAAVEPARAGGGGGAAVRAVEPAAPILPAEIVAALQEHHYKDALQALDALTAKPDTKPEQAAYFGLIAGIARRLDGQLDAARNTLDTALKAEPKGRWTVKIRSEMAAVELAAGRFEQAEGLTRAEAESLLDTDRKDQLAGVYKTFADSLLKPAEPVTPADPEGAHALLEQGRGLAKGTAMRARLLLALARASQAAGNPARAIGEFQAYVDEYKNADLDPADDDAARFGLGEAQLAAGQALPARLTWDDLVRHPRARTGATPTRGPCSRSRAPSACRTRPTTPSSIWASPP